jgi:hypothetical protein
MNNTMTGDGGHPPEVLGGVEEIRCNDHVIAIIVFGAFSRPGIHFFTPSEFSQQLAYMNHPQGKKIAAHIHQPAPREVLLTQEVLFIRKGKMRVDFYDKDQRYLESRNLHGGDTILLIDGGHGFEVLEDLEMFEVKQGPFVGDRDKKRFEAILPETLDFGPSEKQ